ncbi:UDP-glucuronate 4-epimerase 1-like [Cynara cardunculus var. scolymus]|uniref:UDP-glucuronate 4-epimerase n=1 Tax=Cynara cardunculus var. scolymus TaxID=59895 RepID=A0A103XMV1_CYNCS|nr:UDP-glucuronate 4-epimerase 1-like [Cynara cardunculus var. scolymus]KVH93726.1 NAD-dependent epimerase/dehydratase [Cynara cardunculus var. scolymus]
MPPLEEALLVPSSPGRFKIYRPQSHIMNRAFHRCFASTTMVLLWALILIAFTASYLTFVDTGNRYLHHSSFWDHGGIGGIQWEKKVRSSAQILRADGISVLVTGAAGFIGTHVALALKTRGDGVVGVDNFDNYYGPSLKRTRRALLEAHGVFIVDGDINDQRLLAKLFDTVAFTHVMHLAAQVGVRYGVDNPYSYVHSNVAGLVTLLEQCKCAGRQPAVVWASSGSVYGVNNKAPFSESDPANPPASLYASTKKTGEEITHTYNRLYGLSITGLRFFTVYGPWGRPDMVYFSFTRNISEGTPITVYRVKDRVDLARDFIYIDDVVKGCVASLDTSGKSTGSGGKKKGSAPYRIFNLGNSISSPVTVPAMVRILEDSLGMKAKMDVTDVTGNVDFSFPHVNISLAQKELGYNPTTDLQSGLRKFVKWYLWYYGKPSAHLNQF